MTNEDEMFELSLKYFPYVNPIADSPIKQALLEMANWALPHQWISIDDELPQRDNEFEECSIIVLVRGDKRYSVAYYDFHNNTWYSEEGCNRLYSVTHWMEIPTEGGEE